MQVVKSFQNTDELEQFLLNHGENIVDLMGGEIDRIEMKLRVFIHIRTNLNAHTYKIYIFCFRLLLEQIPRNTSL